MSYIIAIVSSIILLGSNLYTTNLEAASKSSSKNSDKKKLAITDRAFKFETSWFSGVNAHRAYYKLDYDVVVVATVFNDISGMLQPGAQYIVHGNGVIMTMSTDLKTKKVDGVKYFVYTYDNFYVYTSDHEQFFVSK